MKRKPFTSKEREALAALLERYGGSLQSFLDLRPDSYEHAIARQSLEHLEQVYAQVLAPGQTMEEARENCPPWPAAGTSGAPSKYAGKLPSQNTLCEIGTRLRTEATLNDLGRVSHFVDKVRSRATKLPIGQQPKVLDTIMTLVGEEMVQQKLTGGKSVLENLDAVDRLLSNDIAKTKAQFEQQKIDIRKQAEERQRNKLKFEMDKLKDQVSAKLLDKAVRDAAEKIATSTSMTRTQQIAAMRKAAFADVDEMERSGAVKLPDPKH